MIRIVTLALAMLLPLQALAQDALPERRVVLTRGYDLPGGDLGPVFNVTLEACTQLCIANARCDALVYNEPKRACFPKAEPGEPVPFPGAMSGTVKAANPSVVARAAQRLSEAGRWLNDGDRQAAARQTRNLPLQFPSDEAAFETGTPAGIVHRIAALAAQSDASADWTALSDVLRQADEADVTGPWEKTRDAIAAATNAWLRAADPAEADAALAAWARAADRDGRGRDGLSALRLAGNSPDAATLREEFARRFGLSVTGNRVETDSPEPRICVAFSEELATNVDLRPFVALPDPALGVERQGSDLCVTGIPRGADIKLTMRAGLPAASGETLPRDVAVSAYVRDRSPVVRFPGRAYVLPASGDQGLTMQTINAADVDLTLYRMSDRTLAQALGEGIFGGPLEDWRAEQFRSRMGTEVWRGHATPAPAEGGGAHAPNAEVATRLDLRAEAGPLEPGVYLLMAEVPDVSSDISPPAAQWFMISDLGLSSYSGTDGLSVAVRGLSDAAARAGIEVALISRGNAVLGKAVTDDQGIARFDAGLLRGKDAAEPALLTAQRMDGDRVADLSFLSLVDPEFDLSDRGVEGSPPAPPIDVFVALDRGAYRAGETAHATIMVRDDRANAIDGLPLTAVILRPGGAEQARLTPAAAGAGGFVLDVPIPATAPRGTWRVDLRVEEDGPPLASARMLVEDFLPERITFDLELPPVTPGMAGRLDAGIDARWLFGAPAADQLVEGELMLTPAREIPAYPGYVFGRHDDSETRAARTISGRTDETGHFNADVALPEDQARAARPVSAELRLRVLEGAARPVERQATTLLLPDRPSLGIRPAFEDRTVPEGETAGFDVMAVGADGKTVREDTVEWQLNRIETNYQWYAVDGDWQWEPITRRSAAGSGRIALPADGAARLETPVGWGEYELVVKAGEAETSMTFWAGWGAASGARDTPDKLRVTLDRPAYRAGETAQVSFDAPAAGSALVSVMSNRLISLQTVSVKAGRNSLSLPVTDDWQGGVYVGVSAIRPVGADAGHAPVRALGLAPAAMDPGERKLAVTLTAPEETEPRRAAKVTLAVAGAAAGESVHATVWAVDQGILNLTGTTPPSASAHYFGQHRLGVGLRDLYGRLILPSGAADGAIRSGGDEAGGSTVAPPPTEKLMAWFSGPLTLGPDGTASVEVPLPDFNGEVRLMALAWTPRAVGEADRTMLVRDPVVMTVTAPPFLAPGDTATVQITLNHVSGPAGQVGLVAEALPGTDPVPLALADLPASAALADRQRLPLAMSVTAPEVEGIGAFRLTTSLPDGKVVTKDITVPVRRLDAEVTRALRLTLAPGETVTPDLTPLGSFVPGSGRVTLSAGAYAALDVPQALTLLRTFPYGCTEQIASAAIPLLYVADLMADLPLPPGGDPSAALPMPAPEAGQLDTAVSDPIAASVARILTRQTAEGAFGLWNAESGEPWLDAFATDFLSRARAAGHPVPDQPMRRALANLQNRLNAASDPQYATPDEAAAIAYAAQVLARERAAMVSDLRYYADTGAASFATPMSAAQLGAALALAGDEGRAGQMFSRAAGLLARDEDPGGLRQDFGTLLRDRAAVLALAVEAGSDRIDRDRIASSIAEAIAQRTAEGAGVSTQEAMWVVMAAHALARGRDPGQGVTLSGAEMPSPVADLGDASAPLALPVANTGASPVDVTISATAVPADPITAGGTAFSITRSYYSPDGQPVDPTLVPQGERMVVVLDIRPFDAEGGRLIVTDPLPAGFEIDNPDLIRSGGTDGLDWIGDTASTEMAEFRADRFAASLTVSGDDPFRLAYRIRAVHPGSFSHPAARVADFYRPTRRGWTDNGRVNVVR